MRKTLIPAVIALALSACDSSTIQSGPSQSSIVIPDTARENLTSLPSVNFDGRYETTARPELGTSTDSGGGADSAEVR